MRKIIVCILSILLLLAVVSAQDSATGATSAGDGCQSDEEVTKKVDEWRT